MTSVAARPAPIATPRAPYSLEPCGFPLPALAAHAGRAPLGGPREATLGCLVVARLLCDRADSQTAVTSAQRETRGKHARQWLGTAAVPAPVKSALSRLADVCATGTPKEIGAAMATVMAVTANYLDPAALSELERLAQAVAE